jgi:Cu2+-exporting ATPase
MGASWHDAVVTGIAVLIITCPCALGLAIPTVQTVAAGAMFKAGVLLNSGDAIERLAETDHVLFDKTGTLTLPELEVVNAADVPADVFALAGQLALSSHHPVAAAVAEAASAKSPLVGAVEEPGRGLRAECGGVEIRLGKPSFCGAEPMARDNANLGPEASIVAFSRGEERYLFSVRQALRQDARAAISSLEQRGIAVEILSGDREPAIRTAAGVLGIDEWRAGITSADKIARIEELKRRGSKLMMVGDSMNDAPSLAAAHVSMSPISAAHLSQSTADLVFLGKPLAPVVAAIDHSRKALHLMRQNLWLAVGYNLLAVPIAISGIVTPLIVAAAISGSSILVMLNGLRARNAGSKARPAKFDAAFASDRALREV